METTAYIKQLEAENMRLKNENESLISNNYGMLQNLTKLQQLLNQYRVRYGYMEQDYKLVGRVL